MSGESTIVHGKNFTLYNECLDDENVYLRLIGVKFNVTNNRVQIKIPIEIWGIIRDYGMPDLKFANWTDEQIKEHAESEIDKRIQNFQESMIKNPNNTLRSAYGLLYYGSGSDENREYQLSAAIEQFNKYRERDTRIFDIIEDFKNKQEERENELANWK
jgi:hypothetical protein